MLIGSRRALLFKRPTVSGSLLLDKLSATSLFAVSSRKLRTAYAGSALKVTTSAGGNATQDIGFASGNLDTTALATFIGANSGSINTWYDQSPGALNATNAAVAQQPTIVASGTNVTQNGHVWAAGTSADALGSSLAQAQSYSVAILGKFDALGVSNSFIGTQFAGFHLSIGSTAGNNLVLNAGGSNLAVAGADTSVHTFIYILANGASSSIIVDGTTVATGNPGTDALAGFDLWDFNTSVHIGEVLFFSGVLSAPDQALIRSDWQTYWGAP